jgi:hypothetical protein
MLAMLAVLNILVCCVCWLSCLYVFVGYSDLVWLPVMAMLAKLTDWLAMLTGLLR